MTPEDLQIVIPAYRAKYLPELLHSLANQTSKCFSVIVADDGSPERIETICASFVHLLNLRYVRFELNLGKYDLVGHWNRALKLSTGSWIMLPGDDDYLSSNAVEEFWRTVKETNGRFDVYRLSLRKINKKSKIIHEKKPSTEVTSAFEFLIRQEPAFPVTMIFSRRALDRSNGFVSFDLAWHSDNASFAQFASKTGIASIPHAWAYWRTSSENISSSNPQTEPIKYRASLEFLRWLKSKGKELGFTEDQIEMIVQVWTWRLYINHNRELWHGRGFRRWIQRAAITSIELSRVDGKSTIYHLLRFIRSQIETLSMRSKFKLKKSR